MSEINNQITLSGSGGIEVDEIDFAEGGKFFIGGKNPANKAMATNENGELVYSDNDFIPTTIKYPALGVPINYIVCESTHIRVVGNLDIASKHTPIQVEGNMPNSTFLGINENGEFGYYPLNVIPEKIQKVDAGDNIVSKVECYADASVAVLGWSKFDTITPFWLNSQPLGVANQVLGIDSDGNMKWIFITKPNIPITADLDINSLVVEGFIPLQEVYGVDIKKGLHVDGFSSFQGQVEINLGLNIKGLLPNSQNGLEINEGLLVMKNIDCRASLQLHDNIYLSVASNISINGDVGSIKQVITKDDNNNLKWIDIDTLIPPPSSHGLIAGLNIDQSYLDYGTIATLPDVEFYSVKVDGGGLDVMNKIKINGVSGTKDQIIVANDDGTIRWDIVENISPTPDPDGVVVNFIDSNVRPANQQAIEWERILDCRLINTLKNGSTANHQRIVSPIDLRNNMPDVGTGHASSYDPWAHWYFRKPRGLEEIVHFDFSFLVDVKKSPIFIPQLTTDTNFWALQVGFKTNSIYSLNMNIILHSTVSSDVIINTTNKAFRLFYRNNTGTTLTQFPNEAYAIGALPCNLNLDIKLHYKADSNVVDMYMECWTDVVLKTATEYIQAGNNYGTRVFYSGMDNYWYDVNIP